MITLDKVSVEFSKILNEVKKKKTPKESKRKRQKIILLTIKENKQFLYIRNKRIHTKIFLCFFLA